MSQCQGKLKSGNQCRRNTKPGEVFCSGHDPTRAKQRTETARKGGKAYAANWKEIETLAAKFPVWKSWEHAAKYAAIQHLDFQKKGDKAYSSAWYKHMLRAMECRDRKIDSERPIKVECTQINLPRPTNGDPKGRS